MRAISIETLGLGFIAAMACACGSAEQSSSSGEEQSAVSGAASPRGGATTGAASSSEAATTSASALTPVAGVDGARFVFVQSTQAGYVLTELNTPARGETVTTVDFSATGANTRDLSSVIATPRTVAALGTIQGTTFVAQAAYRALPDVMPASGDAFYVASAGSIRHEATEVNTGLERTFTRLDVSKAAVPFEDQAWLSARVIEGTAVAAGSFSIADESEAFHVSAIYLRLPDTATCPARGATCGEGTIPMYERDANRCLVQTGCTKPGMCPMFMPLCEPDYDLSRWPAREGGCAQFACDPSFDPPPAP